MKEGSSAVKILQVNLQKIDLYEFEQYKGGQYFKIS